MCVDLGLSGKCIFGVFRAQGTCMVSANTSVKRNFKIEANVVVIEFTIYYCIVAYLILRDYFYTCFMGVKNTSPVAALALHISA